MGIKYDNYKNFHFICTNCHWEGLGSEAFLSDLSELHTLRDVECPKCSNTLITFDLSKDDQEID